MRAATTVPGRAAAANSQFTWMHGQAGYAPSRPRAPLPANTDPVGFAPVVTAVPMPGPRHARAVSATRRPRASRLALAGTGAALVLATGGYVFVVDAHAGSAPSFATTGKRSIALPTELGQFRAMQTSAARSMVAGVTQELTANGATHVSAQVYSADGLTVGASAFISDIPVDISRGPRAPALVTSFFGSFTAGQRVSKPVVMGPGRNGGAMTCGLRFASAGAAPAAFCIWSDGSTLSEVSVYRGTVPAAHAIALAVRAANGH